MSTEGATARAHYADDDGGPRATHWATRCWGDDVVNAVKTVGLTDNWGKFLILVVVVFTVSWYGLVSP